jgi:hypothetical protein
MGIAPAAQMKSTYNSLEIIPFFGTILTESVPAELVPLSMYVDVGKLSCSEDIGNRRRHLLDHQARRSFDFVGHRG